MKTVRAVEHVDTAAFKRPDMLQIVHDNATLYLQADGQTGCEDWFEAHTRSPCAWIGHA